MVGGMATVEIEKLNTVATSVESWLEFCEYSMQTPFYRLAMERLKDPEKAAALTLLRSYLSTFSQLERLRLERDAEYFYGYARGFINELATYRYSKDGYDHAVRAVFIGKIRKLLNEQKGESGAIKDYARYVFIRTIVRFCSSLAYILEIHDLYKEFLFRELPQVPLSRRPLD